MVTKRNALLMGILFVLLLTSACGAAPAATQAPPSTQGPITDYIPEEPAATEAPAAMEEPVTGYLPQQSPSNVQPSTPPSN